MKKITVVVMFISILSKVLGFLRDIFLSSSFGVGAVTDAFNLALTIPNSVLSVIGAALVTGLIPMLTKLSKQSGERTNRFISNIMNIMLAFCAVIMIILFILPEIAIFIFASNLGVQAAVYAIPFIRITALGMFSIALVQLGSGYLNVKKNFIIPALITIPSNILVIISIVVSSRLVGKIPNAENILAFGQLLALLLQSAIIILYMKKSGFKYSMIIDVRDEDLRVMVTLALPLLLSAVLGQFNDIVMKNMATSLHNDGTGGYSFMTYATKLVGFVSGIFITAILNVTYPTIAHNVVEGDVKKINKSINDAILMISVFIIPAMVGFILMAPEIVQFVYLRGKVTMADVNVIVPIFIFDTLVLFAMACRELMFRIHYAYHDMKSPVRNTVFVSVVFLIGVTIFPSIFGKFNMPLAGLAFAYSLAAALACIPLYRSVKRLLGKMYLQYIVKDMVKILISALVMGLVIFIIKGPVQGLLASGVLAKASTIVVIGLAVGAYFIALIAFRTNFVLSIISSFVFKDKQNKA